MTPNKRSAVGVCFLTAVQLPALALAGSVAATSPDTATAIAAPPSRCTTLTYRGDPAAPTSLTLWCDRQSLHVTIAGPFGKAQYPNLVVGDVIVREVYFSDGEFRTWFMEGPHMFVATRRVSEPAAATSITPPFML